MRNIKIWPHITVAIVVALIAGIGVTLLMRQRTSAEGLPHAARIQQVDGEVALQNGPYDEDDTAAVGDWMRAEANQPFTVGDRIYTRDNSRASLAFSGRNFAQLYPNTSLDALMFTDDRTQLALRDGSALFDVGYLDSGGLFEVATPYGAVNFNEPGLYSVALDEGGVLIAVLSGLAQVVGMDGSGQIRAGEVLRLVGQTAADIVLSRLNPQDAGYFVDDYYSYQYPNYYDGRYRDYNVYLEDPFFFDPYRRNVSYQYVSPIVPGVNDLDYYGNWVNLADYGYVWMPQVESSWAPYQQGYWVNHYPYGPTWVSTEPWGYAPYHYGRWVNVENQWYWIPEAVNTRPTYSPALVAFVPLDGSDAIGWVPLGPGDPYIVRYYDSSWQPQYITRADVVRDQLINFGVPGAVTVVSIDDFGRVIDHRRVRRVEPHVLAQVNPVLEPLLLTPLRNAVLHSAWGRGKIAIPPGIAKKLVDTPVIISDEPSVPPFRREMTRSLRVEAVPARVRNRRLNVRDEREGQEARGQDQKPPAPAERGRGGREQVAPRVDQRGRGRGAPERPPQAQGERVGNPRQQRPQAERPEPPQQPPRKAEGKQGPPANPGQSGKGKGRGGKP